MSEADTTKVTEMAQDTDGIVFRKSKRSFAEGNCVEVASLGDSGVLVRHSKRPDELKMHFSKSEWNAFVLGVKDGEFDL